MLNQNKISHIRRRAGMSIVEILIAMSIAALLLVATAFAFDAALDSYKENYDLNVASVSSRNGLYQMCTTIRSAWNDPNAATIDINETGTQCSLVDANGRNIIYRYDSQTNQLQVNLNGTNDWYVMVDNVSPIAQGKEIFLAIDPDDTSFPAGTVGKVIVRFKVQSEQISQPVSASVVPRNIVYTH